MVEANQGKNKNVIFGIAIVLLLIAVFVVYSALQTPVTTGGQQPQLQAGVQPDLTQPTVQPTFEPALTQSTTGPQATQTPANEVAASSGDCTLFKNKYTSEFKCIACVSSANNPDSACIYTSRDWVEVATGTSGYSCEYDATLELKCKTIKA